MKYLEKLKGFLKGHLSLHQVALTKISKESSKYGVTIGPDLEKVDGKKIHLTFENHIISTKKLHDVEQLFNNSSSFHFSEKLSEKIKDTNGKDKDVDGIINGILDEAKNHGVKLPGSEQEKRLYATAKLAEHMGSGWKTEYVSDGHRKKLIIEIDPNNAEFSPEQQITMLLTALNVGPEMRKTVIDRYNEANKQTEQTPTKFVENQDLPMKGNLIDQNKDIVGELAKVLQVQDPESSELQNDVKPPGQQRS